jgi:hypothetical protein
MKLIKIPSERGAKAEIAKWLQENISEENGRWWFNGRIYGDQQQDGYIPSWETVMVDVTEEEKSMLTFVMLKWVKSPE